MNYINVGAYVDGSRPKTKKDLREAVKAAPESVRFDPTSAFDRAGHIPATDVPVGVTLQVTGPDPHTARNWYASVKMVAGKVKFS